jgi:site-specific DNA-methyltransferase (adenine-specific)
MTVQILVGDCRHRLRELADASVHCCVTSPPYFGLRDYGVAGQIGLESSPSAYIGELVGIFAEVRRVLRPDGTLFVNLGDSYAGYHGSRGASVPASSASGWASGYDENKRASTVGVDGLKEKDLIVSGWMLGLALQQDGWVFRKEVIWSKKVRRNPRVTDRPDLAHERILILSRGSRYWFDKAAMPSSVIGPFPAPSIPGHPAVMPEALAHLCIRAGCPVGGTVLDPFGGSGTTALAARHLGRNAVLVEINPDYAALAERRLTEDAPLLRD